MHEQERIFDDRRSGDDRRDDPSLRVNWNIVLQVIGWALGLAVVYSAMTSRITALETNRVNDVMRQERIENKVDRILERLK